MASLQWTMETEVSEHSILDWKSLVQINLRALVTELIQKKKQYRFLILSNFWALPMESLCLTEQ